MVGFIGLVACWWSMYILRAKASTVCWSDEMTQLFYFRLRLATFSDDEHVQRVTAHVINNVKSDDIMTDIQTGAVYIQVGCTASKCRPWRSDSLIDFDAT